MGLFWIWAMGVPMVVRPTSTKAMSSPMTMSMAAPSKRFGMRCPARAGRV
jgi:hypothetical protein